MAEISLQEYCGQIENLIEQGRYTEAVSHGKHVLQKYPKYVAAYRLLGKAMLEANQDEYAADMFRRVLSADPEDMLAWVALSEVHNKRNQLDAALWYMERAFELSVENRVVEDELRQLYGRRDGVELERAQLTRGGLARLYLKGDLLSRAISEFRALLAEQPDRVDLSVALAEALWRNEQRLEAAEVCQRVLDELPYCLKANLILGEIWTSSGREEAQAYLQRAEALDPESQMAQALFGSASPLPPREVQIAPLEYRPPTEEERPAWMAGIEAAAPPGEREATLVDIAAALEAQIEIPAWLEEIEVGEATTPAPLAFLETPPSEETAPVPAEQVPEWLTGIREGPFEEAAPAAGIEAAEAATGWAVGLTAGEETALGEKEEIPEWLSELGMKPLDTEKMPAAAGQEEIPDWLAELNVQPTGEAAQQPPAVPGQEEVPDWLAELGVKPGGEAAGPAASAAEQPPDWLEGLRDQFTPEETAPVTEAAPPVAEGAPAWLEGEGMPSGEEAMAWLSQLAAGKEDQLRAQAEVEAEARMAEIMGRPAPAEAAPPPAAIEIPERVQELAPTEAAPTPPPPAEPVIPPVEEIAPPAEPFGWAAFGEPAMPPVAEEAAEAIAPQVEEAAPPSEISYEPQAVPSAVEVRQEVAREVMVEEIAMPRAAAEPKPTPPKKPAAPPKAVPGEVSEEPFPDEQAYLKEHPRDYDAWLALARALWQVGEQESALEAYSRVIHASKLLGSVVPDLEEYLLQWPSIGLERVLGDAYMKTGRLEEALGLYRQALETL